MRHWPRVGLSLALGGFLVWLLIGRLSAIKPAEVAHAFAALPAQAWVLAVLATMVSFWAVGSYDDVIHRHFATGLPPARTRLAGICSIAVSQMIGLGVVSGAVVRWRMLPEINLWQATRLTAAVALSFLGAWAMVTALVLLSVPSAPFKGAATAALALGLAFALLCLAAPRIGTFALRWPNLFTLRRLFCLCLADTFAAAMAFYLLCPPGIDIGFAVLLPVFLLALGAGLVSGTPGGMGAFEMTLLALLPGQPEPDLIAAVLAWRIVYFALPAILGAALAILGPQRRGQSDTEAIASSATQALVSHAPQAEVQLWRQGEHGLIGAPATGAWVAGRTLHGLVGLFAPIFSDPAFAHPNSRGANTAITALIKAAKAEGRMPILYKAAPHLAATARARGFAVVAIAREASFCLASYRIESSSRSGLRRKLRRAEAAGVCIQGADSTADWPQLTEIAREWAQAHGGERGFSMGRFAIPYVQGQRLFVAALNDQPIAFVTAHAGPDQWVLDLMRHKTGVPDGTMHLLVQAAIDEARAEGIAEFSLAAVPEIAFGPTKGWIGHLLLKLGADDGSGLGRFKSAFAPRWQRRYLCAPGRISLLLAAVEIARTVHSPPPLAPEAAKGSGPDPLIGEEQVSPEYWFASAS